MTSTDTVERVAREVYAAMRWTYYDRCGIEAPIWSEGGNALAQDEARKAARAAIAAMPSPDVGEAARVLLDQVDQIWNRNLSTDTHNAREKAKRDGHKYVVIDREGFRAVLRALSTPPKEDV